MGRLGEAAMTSDQPKYLVEDADWASAVIDVLEEFRNVYADMTMNQALTLMQIGLNPGTSQKRLTEALRLDDGTVSRISAVMSNRRSRGREGLGLIEIKLDSQDYRFRVQSLSNNGLELWSRLRGIMEGLRNRNTQKRL